MNEARPPRALPDTNGFFASATGRSLATHLLPDEGPVCVVTLAELQVGVLAAADVGTWSTRLATLNAVAAFTALEVDSSAAAAWSTMRVRLAECGLRADVNDLWIAAVAVANGLLVVTQDSDFRILKSVGGPDVEIV